MPVTLETVRQPSAQDTTDLLKTFADCPPSALAVDAPADADTLTALRQHHEIRAGRFNGRLIAALVLTECNDGDWRLDGVCVRTVTRDRGVGRRLLELLLEQLTADGRSLRVPRPDDSRAVDWLTAHGFVPDGNALRRPG